MAQTLDSNIRGENSYKGLLLNCSHHSGTALDYEDSESLSTIEDDYLHNTADTANPSDVNVVPILPKSSEYVNSSALLPFREEKHPLQEGNVEYLQAKAKSNTRNICKILQGSKNLDVLDLQRISEKFSRAEERKLEDKLDFTTRLKLLKLILALNELPHLHVSTHRGKGKSARVTDWLNKCTSHPEPELCGFSLKDPVHIRKFVTDISPKMSSSDTNITLGKRKRGFEDNMKDDVTSGLKSSSDTCVCVHADWSRNGAGGKRRRLFSN
ncbi:uncharacterized protein LOC132750635 isoform X2 [Ruditapes philippinarum]|uniref:uncharacterized protein LOC132750635 isoform X2 n=1 Tax=Ruditapes philippinarum TaxID=129788 RepID=UPI00295B9AD0|nr:uncharacterized protein LOC132750635 isoform X2 [Ruditapes philippinarum]